MNVTLRILLFGDEPVEFGSVVMSSIHWEADCVWKVAKDLDEVIQLAAKNDFVSYVDQKDPSQNCHSGAKRWHNEACWAHLKLGNPNSSS